MTQVKVQFPDAMETSLITLYGIAGDTVIALSPALLDDLPPGAAPRGSTLACRLAQLVPPVRDMSVYARYEIVGT